jgi:hypothetical protein
MNEQILVDNRPDGQGSHVINAFVPDLQKVNQLTVCGSVVLCLRKGAWSGKVVWVFLGEKESTASILLWVTFYKQGHSNGWFPSVAMALSNDRRAVPAVAPDARLAGIGSTTVPHA